MDRINAKVTASTITGFVGHIFDRRPDPDRILVFRGHASEDFTLTPSVFRKISHQENEESLLKELVASEPGEFLADASTFDILVRMQHYSLPTRLLDVTLNPLVALYFATEEVDNERLSNVGEVVVISVPVLRAKYYDSDTVSIHANLARLAESERRSISNLVLDPSITKKRFNDSPVVDRLVQFIRDEKPAFRKIIDPPDLSKVLLVVPKKSNKRIVAQSGQFFIFGCAIELEACSTENEIKVTKIKVQKKEQLRNQLDLLSINGRSLYPEIESAAKYIRQKFDPVSVGSK